MNESYWVVGVVAIGVLVVMLIVLSQLRQRRTRGLASRFGPEYDHAVATLGKRTAAEKELEARAKRVDSLAIHPLVAAERERFRGLWEMAQSHFVDSPVTAVAEADRLVAEVMRARGYPVADFEQRAADVSVGHPQLVEHYRFAHAAAANAGNGSIGTEDLRQAIVHLRALFEDLLEVPEPMPATS
jgi:hypothetical protein